MIKILIDHICFIKRRTLLHIQLLNMRYILIFKILHKDYHSRIILKCLSPVEKKFKTLKTIFLAFFIWTLFNLVCFFLTLTDMSWKIGLKFFWPDSTNLADLAYCHCLHVCEGSCYTRQSERLYVVTSDTTLSWIWLWRFHVLVWKHSYGCISNYLYPTFLEFSRISWWG